MHCCCCCCCCCCSWSCCRWSLGHDLAAKKQCPLSVDPGMVKKPAPGNRAGARGFAGRARGPSAPGVRANGRVMHRRPRRWTPTAFPGGSSPATGRKSHKKAKKFKVIIGSISLTIDSVRGAKWSIQRTENECITPFFLRGVRTSFFP